MLCSGVGRKAYADKALRNCSTGGIVGHKEHSERERNRSGARQKALQNSKPEIRERVRGFGACLWQADGDAERVLYRYKNLVRAPLAMQTDYRGSTFLEAACGFAEEVVGPRDSVLDLGRARDDRHRGAAPRA